MLLMKTETIFAIVVTFKMQYAVCELKQAFEGSWMYKSMVKLLDWLEDKLEK